MSDGRETGRVEAFSDGVFAIAMTLLVLGIKVPRPRELGDRGLAAALAGEWPDFLAYLTSFLTILVMWVNHHILFGHIRRVTPAFLFLNGLLLLLVTFVPFPTQLVAEFAGRPEASVAARIYSGTFVVIAISFNVLWRYAASGGRLLATDADPTVVRSIARQYVVGPPAYFAAFLLASGWVDGSMGLCLLLAVYFAFTGSLSGLSRKRRDARTRIES